MLDALKRIAAGAMSTWHQATTERDNATKCPIRLGAAGVAVIYHAAAAYMVFGQHTNVTTDVLGAYVTHMVGLLGATGITVTTKGAFSEGAR